MKRLMQGTRALSPYQFAIFRWLLGLYLAVHFVHLIPWAPELFSADGVFPDAAASPLHGLFPNVLAVLDVPLAVQAFLALLAIAALCFAAGFARPAAALVLWYGWTCLFHRNLLISNPGLPYVGLMLVLSALVPAGEGLRPGGVKPREGWAFPVWLWRAAFVSLMAGYTYSGLVKLASPSWLGGDAMGLLLTNPLARDGVVRELLLALPDGLLAGLTWWALAGEILAFPLCLLRKGRLVAWCWMLSMHLGIVLVVDFADLTLGMILAHLFVFDPAWLPPRKDGAKRVVFFDGVCALCDESVRFLVAEDRERVLRYAPLQGETAASQPEVAALIEAGGTELKTLIYLRQRDGEPTVLTRSDAVLAILDDLGGLWRLGALARFVPRAVRDRVYEFVGRNRYRWFGRLEACRLPRPEEAGLFLD